MRKEISIIIIVLIFGAGFWPIVNANINVFSSINDTTIENNYENLVKVTCQLSTPIDFKEISKEIPEYRAKKIIELSCQINNLLEKNLKFEEIKEKIIELEIELKQAKIISENIDLVDTLGIISKFNEKTRFLDTFSCQKHLINANETKNNFFNLVFGLSKNYTFSIPWLRSAPLLILTYLLDKYLNRTHNFLHLLIGLCILRPKIMGWHLGWASDGYASIKTIGLTGIKTLDNFGPGYYMMDLIGFIGLSMHLQKYGGFVIGYSLFSAIFFETY